MKFTIIMKYSQYTHACYKKLLHWKKIYSEMNVRTIVILIDVIIVCICLQF